MDIYIQKIKRRILILGIGIVLAVLFLINNQLRLIDFNLSPVNNDISNFQNGLLAGLTIIALLHMVRNCRAVKDRRMAELLYNKEQDERLSFIRQKSGMPMLMITSILLILSGIAAGYFNSIIFYTMIIAGAAQLTLGAIVKLVYMKLY